MFQYDTEDAGLIYLANKIDDGIKARIDFNDSPGAKKIRKWYNRLYPLQILILCTYIIMTLFETPSWCLEKMHAIETQMSAGKTCGTLSLPYKGSDAESEKIINKSFCEQMREDSDSILNTCNDAQKTFT